MIGQVSQALARTTVLDPKGRLHVLESLWHERTAVIVFLRHFGCIFCREQVARFGAILEEIRAGGAEVFAIGNGSPAMAADFVSGFDVEFPVFTDPDRVSYAAAGMQRRFGIGPTTFARAAKNVLAGHRQGRTQGDPWQQGGLLIVAPSGEIKLHHVESTAGEHLDMDPVLRALAVG